MNMRLFSTERSFWKTVLAVLLAGTIFGACGTQSESSVTPVVACEKIQTDPLLGEPFVIYPIRSEHPATLIRYPFDSSARRSKGIVLYVHGYNDYFFQRELAKSLDSAGYAFFAIDLHRYGRSLRSSDRAFDADSVGEYFPELDSAVSMAKRLVGENLPVALIGHSTGGLVVSLYADSRNRGKNFFAIVLNSPFLDMNMNALVESVAIPAVSFLAKWFPDVKMDESPNPNYGMSLHESEKGEWDYDLRLKPLVAPPKTLGWIRAIHLGHLEVQKGLQIETPVLVMHSSCSVDEKIWTEAYAHCDGVLDVKDIHRYGAGLGKNVTLVEVEGGMHDLYLSREDVRNFALSETLRFLDSRLGAR